MQDISSRMDAVCRRFEELSIRLNQPDTAADPALFRKLMREYHDTEPVVEAYRDWQTALDHLAQAKALLEEPGSLDPDFKQMIQQEIGEKSQDVAKLENNLKILLLPKDVNDGKNVIMEIRGGAGGEEAALFAHSLLRMYTMYAQNHGVQPRFWAYMVYMRSRLWANKAASSPPAPPRISMMTFLPSFTSLGSSKILRLFSSFATS